MSLLTRICTGLTEMEWRDWFAKIQHASPDEEFSDGSGRTLSVVKLAEFREAVIAEGRNRRFIHYAMFHQRISLRTGVLEVLNEAMTTPTFDLSAMVGA